MIAQEILSLQGCRRGTPRPQSTHFRRSGGEERQPGGDFYHGERHQLTVLVAFNDRSFVGHLSCVKFVSKKSVGRWLCQKNIVLLPSENINRYRNNGKF